MVILQLWLATPPTLRKRLWQTSDTNADIPICPEIEEKNVSVVIEGSRRPCYRENLHTTQRDSI